MRPDDCLGEDCDEVRERERLAARVKELEAQAERHTKALEESPWPSSIWTLSEEEYVAVVPDARLRTRISGLLMRKGWEAARDAMKGEGE